MGKGRNDDAADVTSSTNLVDDDLLRAAASLAQVTQERAERERLRGRGYDRRRWSDGARESSSQHGGTQLVYPVPHENPAVNLRKH